LSERSARGGGFGAGTSTLGWTKTNRSGSSLSSLAATTASGTRATRATSHCGAVNSTITIAMWMMIEMRTPSRHEMARPTGDMSGRWSSKSKYIR
jgi:hypothetical protein